MSKIERTMKSERIYDGKILSLKIETVELPNRKYSKREIIEHEAAAAVVAMTDNDEIVMVKQYRKAIDKIIYELPAGLLDLNESPKDAAIRELKEETGYITNDIEYLLEFYPSPGFCTEKIYIFAAENLTLGEKNLDPDEFVECENIPYEKALRMIMLGEIVDGKTITGILTYNQLRRKR